MELKLSARYSNSLNLGGLQRGWETEPIWINLGSGDQRIPGYVGLDRLTRAGTDVICDLNQPLPLAADRVEKVYAKSVLEHIDLLEELLADVERVLRPGGQFFVYVPHWSNPFYYSDYTHVRFFGLATFDYFVSVDHQRFRAVPTYRQLRFHLESARLVFFSPFRGFYILMKAFQRLVNLSPGWQLFYEYHLAPFIPCYAVEYHLRRTE